METAALIIDGNNVSGALGGRRLHLDNLRKHILADGFDLQESHYFLAVRAVMDEETYDRHLTYRRMLDRKGFKVWEKQMERAGEGWKGDCDIAMALIAADAVDLYDWILLLSNDSDFCDLADYVHRHGKKMAAISIDGDAALRLRQSVDRYIDLSGAKGIFMRTGDTRRKSPEEPHGM